VSAFIIRGLALTLGCLGLIGCATEQWKAAEAQCRLSAIPIFPVATEQRLVFDMPQVPLLSRCVQVSYKDKDGKDRVRTDCTMPPLMAFPRMETYDLNQRVRDDYVRSCAQQSCFQSHGNTDCKPPVVQAPPKP
jgi:hypothetical protein